MLFAADEEGCVRAYKLPLAASTTAAGGSAGGAAECQSQRCAAGGGISRLAVTHDEALLFAATRDGCVFVYDVKDRVGALAGLCVGVRGGGRGPGEGAGQSVAVRGGVGVVGARERENACPVIQRAQGELGGWVCMRACRQACGPVAKGQQPATGAAVAPAHSAAAANSPHQAPTLRGPARLPAAVAAAAAAGC